MGRKRRITRKVLELYQYQCVRCGESVCSGADLTELERCRGRLVALMVKDVAFCQPCIDCMTAEGVDTALVFEHQLARLLTPQSKKQQPQAELEDKRQAALAESAVMQRDRYVCRYCQRNFDNTSNLYLCCILPPELQLPFTPEHCTVENLTTACTDCAKQLGYKVRGRYVYLEPRRSRVLRRRGNVVYIGVKQR